jgi:hypothetical protein
VLKDCDKDPEKESPPPVAEPNMFPPTSPYTFKVAVPPLIAKVSLPPAA